MCTQRRHDVDGAGRVRATTVEDVEHRKTSCTGKVQHVPVMANVICHGKQQFFVAQADAV